MQIARALAVVLMLASCESGSSRSHDKVAAASSTLQPWEPFDDNFKGCEGG